MPLDWTVFAQDVLKLAVHPRYSFSIWVTSFLLLGIPLPDFLRVDPIRESYGHFVGTIGLTAFVVWLVEMFLFVASEPIKNYFDRREKLKHLNTLNTREASLLFHAITKNCQTVTWRNDTGAVDSLIAKGLLEKVPVTTENRFNFDPVTIPRFVWDRITKPDVRQKIQDLTLTK